MSSAEDFLYVKESIITGVFPSFCPGSSGESVTIRGSGFPRAGDVWCKFGDESTTSASLAFAGMLSREVELTCTCPQRSPGNVSLVILLGQQEVCKPFHFQFHGRSRILSLSPSIANLRGFTLVTLYGSGLRVGAEIECRFGDESGTGLVISASVATCTTPPFSRAEKRELTVAQDGSAIAEGIPFLSIDDLHLEGVKPSIGTAGGSTFVTLSFSTQVDCDWKVQFGALSGSFGRNDLLGQVVMRDAQSISVLTPPSKVVGLVSIMFVCLEQEYEQEGGFFRYLPEIVALSLSPSLGPVNGGVIATLSGQNFERNVDYTIRFSSEKEASAALVPSGLGLVFTVPSGIVGLSVLELVVEGHVIGTNLFFDYHSPLVISTVHPTWGILTGGTVVTVSGAGFVAQMLPSFGSLPASEMTFITSTLFTCLTPQHPVGISKVILEVDHIQIFGPEFTFSPQIRVVSVNPTMAFAGISTLVDIRGSGFLSKRISCALGKNLETTGNLVSSSQLRCTVNGLKGTAVASLRISFDDLHWSSHKDFLIRDQIQIVSVSPHRVALKPTKIKVVGLSLIHI